MELKKIMAENNVSLREAEELLKIDNPKKFPSVTNIRAWPEIKTRNNLTFEDQRKRVIDNRNTKEEWKSNVFRGITATRTKCREENK